MSRDDNETLLSRLLSSAVNFIKPNVQTALQCIECGEWKLKGDSSPCGSHLPLPESDENTQMIRIGFAKPKPQLEPPEVERLGRPSEKRQISNKFKDPQSVDPIQSQHNEPDEPEDIWAEVRGTGGYSRANNRKTVGWDSTAQEIADAMDGNQSTDEFDDPPNDDFITFDKPPPRRRQ